MVRDTAERMDRHLMVFKVAVKIDLKDRMELYEKKRSFLGLGGETLDD